jgi:hypothetical protein
VVKAAKFLYLGDDRYVLNKRLLPPIQIPQIRSILVGGLTTGIFL